MMTALTLLSVVHFSGSHSGAVGTSGEVPGRSEEAQPARRGACAAHGHLPTLPRYCLKERMKERKKESSLYCTHVLFCIPHQCTPAECARQQTKHRVSVC